MTAQALNSRTLAWSSATNQLSLLETALESAPNGIVITDQSAHIVWSNPAFSRLTGYLRSEILGRNIRVLKSGTHDPGFYGSMWKQILAGEIWQGEVTNRRKDGSLFLQEQTITPLRDEQ